MLSFIISSLNSIIMINLSSPVMFMVVILFQTFTSCIILWMLIPINLFSFILFLVFIGGLLIIFSYMCSLTSNEYIKFSFSLKSSLLTMGLFMLTAMTMNYINFTNNLEGSTIILNLNSYMFMTLILVSIMFLFLTLIVIVKISTKNKGPMRANKK